MKNLVFSLLMAVVLCVAYSCETEKNQLIIFDPSSNTGDSSDPSDPGTEQPSEPGTEQPDAPSASELDFSAAKDLSVSGTANSYIVSSSNTYKFKTVKGNSSTSVGAVAKVEVLWESFGTSVTPQVGSLISKVEYKGNYIAFSTPSAFKEGNAVIAVKDAAGKILWSWHIWLTDKPADQVYNNKAGTMMDRNLGATSATSGDVGALGLLYQWGRKDPFLGSSSISESVVAASTIAWPIAVASDASNGTIEYAIAHPTTLIIDNDSNDDWYYTGRNITDDTRWGASKTIYDPCPVGYRVPDGGQNGAWTTAFGTSGDFDEGAYDYISKGFNFGSSGSGTKRLTDKASTCWHPAAGYLYEDEGLLGYTGSSGTYWSCVPEGVRAYLLYLDHNYVYQSLSSARACGMSVRCFKTDPGTEQPSEPGTEQPDAPSASELDFSAAKDLSVSGTANSYIVSSSNTYKFKTVKGNSSTSVGAVAKVEVLWESFGTSVTPQVGSLISKVEYKSNYIAFLTPSAFREGNAVIAAKNAAGKILWSWHIWLTDKPADQVYNNKAGTMMDRNLGATSATSGDVGALGLLYQWGRKDPFLGSFSILSGIPARSTITWPSAVASNASCGTIEYVTMHPTTFITGSSSPYDWKYSQDNTLWQSSKTVYDPCPVGYRVPDGGRSGIWATAFGTSTYFKEDAYEFTDKGFNFGSSGKGTKKLTKVSACWYPAAGYLSETGGSLGTGTYGYYWSCTPDDKSSCVLYFDDPGFIYPAEYDMRVCGQSVRCMKE